MFWHYDILTIFKYALVSEAGDIVTAVVDSNDKPIWSSALKALIVLPTKSEVSSHKQEHNLKIKKS